jgi:hydrogenase/urease accessory protein HupE
MWSRYVISVFCGLLMLLSTSLAIAHLMPAQQGTINLVDNAAFVVLSLPVSGLKKFDASIDANHDGHLSVTELQNHREKIEQYVKQGFRLVDGDDDGMVDFIQVSTESDVVDEGNNIDAVARVAAPGSAHFLVLLKISYQRVPKALRLQADLFGSVDKEKQFSIKASSGKEVEVFILKASYPQHQFFRSALQVMTDYIKTGTEHILTGFDHLLFLLTIIIAGAGWRYWLSILTCFTIAHSITLTLTLVGWLNAPSRLVEPLIALSIIVMAALNLYRRDVGLRSRMVVVFACGLLHGMGFASSIADMGLHGRYFFASLIGFNLGIEFGQAIFLVSFLAMGVIFNFIHGRLFLPRANFAKWTLPLTSVFAMVAGIFMLQTQLIK